MTDHPDITEEEILEWLESSIRNQENILGEGYHGSVYLFEKNTSKFVIKAVHGNAGLHWLRHHQLKNEYQAYQKLEGLQGVPKCYGILDGRYLVLEHVNGVSLRNATVSDAENYYTRYLQLIKDIHARGVAHGDMKRKENLLVVNARDPCVIDFGVAIIRKDGFHPINHFLFNFARQMDFNAWAKHKYRGNYSGMSEQDRQYVKRTLIERVSRQLKRVLYPLLRSR